MNIMTPKLSPKCCSHRMMLFNLDFGSFLFHLSKQGRFIRSPSPSPACRSNITAIARFSSQKEVKPVKILATTHYSVNNATPEMRLYHCCNIDAAAALSYGTLRYREVGHHAEIVRTVIRCRETNTRVRGKSHGATVNIARILFVIWRSIENNRQAEEV